jgi:hypothetical protein
MDAKVSFKRNESRERDKSAPTILPLCKKEEYPKSMK